MTSRSSSMLPGGPVPLSARGWLEGLVAEGEEAVRQAPAGDLYYAIVEVGLQDALDVVQAASPEQFQTFVDLGAWRRDQADDQALLGWLRAAHGNDPEAFLSKVRGLDLELLELLFRRCARIHDLEDNADVSPSGVTVETPEGKYLVELGTEERGLVVMRSLLQLLISENPLETTRFIEAIRWELPAELEETAFRFRTARLADLGFPPLEEALSYFAAAPGRASVPGRSSESALSVEAGAADFFGQAVAALDSKERAVFEDGLRVLVNAVAVAEGAEPGDLASVRQASELGRDTLSLGLEVLSQGDFARAGEVARRLPLKQIFQTGYREVLALKFAADRFAREREAVVGGAYLVLDEEARIVTGLRKKRPLRTVRTEGAPPVPFRSRREVHEAALAIDRAGRQARVLAALVDHDGGAAGLAERIRTEFGADLATLGGDRLFASLVSNAVLDQECRAGPVDEPRRIELCERLFVVEPPRAQVRPRAVEQALEVLGARVSAPDLPELKDMVCRTLDRLAAELGQAYLEHGRLEPTAVTGVPIRGIPIASR